MHLTFLEGVLEDIMLDSRARLAHLDEQRPFALDPFPFLQAVQDANGTLPFLDGDDLYFSKIHATAFQFLIRTQGGRLRSTATF